MRSSTLLYGVAALAATTVSARALPGQSPNILFRRHAFGTPEGNCDPQPLGSGPSVLPDIAEEFQSSTTLADIARGATTPAGSTLQYQNLQAASTTGGYLGYEELTSYDPGYCASQCCNGPWTGCKSFNIYFERDPVVDPGVNCPNPSSTTRIKCSFWSEVVQSSDATNDGQYCSDFHVVIAGSNGYAVTCPSSTTSSTTASSTASSTTSASTTSASTTASTTPASTTSASTTSKSTTSSAATTSATTTSKSTTVSASTTSASTTSKSATTLSSTTAKSTTASSCTTSKSTTSASTTSKSTTSSSSTAKSTTSSSTKSSSTTAKTTSTRATTTLSTTKKATSTTMKTSETKYAATTTAAGEQWSSWDDWESEERENEGKSRGRSKGRD